MPSTESGADLFAPPSTLSFVGADALVGGISAALAFMCVAPDDARRHGTRDAAVSWSAALRDSERSRARLALRRARSAVTRISALPERFGGLPTIGAGLVWTGAFLLTATVVRAWLLAAAGYGISHAIDAVACRPARWKGLPKKETLAIYAVCAAFGVGLWARSVVIAALLFFLVIGCFGPAGMLAGRSSGRAARAITATAAAAGVAAVFSAPQLAPVIAIVLMAWAGFASVDDIPPADIGWAVARSTGAVARFAAAVAVFDILADWRTAGDFRFAVWGEVALPLAVGALVVFGLAVAAFDSGLRPGGVAIAATAAAIPYAFVGKPPGATVAGAAFGLTWVLVGVMRRVESAPRAIAPDPSSPPPMSRELTRALA